MGRNRACHKKMRSSFSFITLLNISVFFFPLFFTLFSLSFKLIIHPSFLSLQYCDIAQIINDHLRLFYISVSKYFSFLLTFSIFFGILINLLIIHPFLNTPSNSLLFCINSLPLSYRFFLLRLLIRGGRLVKKNQKREII